jgi:hypothetical protein
MNAGPSRLPVLALCVAVGVALSAIGISMGLGSQVSEGASETGQGAVVTEHPLTYWTWHATLLGTIPTPAPRLVSIAKALPSLLPRFPRSYTLNAAVAGQTSVAWSFQQTTGAPLTTELMITFVDGLTSPTSTIVAYVETGIRLLGVATTFTFYWDAGTFAPGSLSIETMTATVQACTAIGVCP